MIEVTFFLQEKILILYSIYKKENDKKKILKGNKLYNIYFLYYIYLS